MTKARDLANIISGGFTADDIPNLDASKITSGSIADARIPESAVSQHATSFDDNKIVNDISTLALRQASDQNKSAYNTNSSFVDVFQDDTGIASNTNAPRNASEFVSTVITGNSTITTGTELGSFSGAGTGEQTQSAIDLINNNWSNHNAWTVRTTNQTINSINGDVGEFGSHATFYRASTFSFGGLRMWSGHPNSSSSLGAKDCAVYTSTDTTNGLNGNWTILTPITFNAATNTSAGDRQHAGGRTSQISSNHFVLSDYYNNNNSTEGYSDTVGYVQVTGIKGIRFDIRTAWGTGYYGSEKPHMAQIQIFDDMGLTATVENATGNFTGTTITAPSSVSQMGAIITYQDNAGTNALNTDIVLQLSADNGSTYSTATLTALPDFSTGIKMAKVNDLAVTAGTQLKYKLNFANQASGSKEARIRGVSLQY